MALFSYCTQVTRQTKASICLVKEGTLEAGSPPAHPKQGSTFS